MDKAQDYGARIERGIVAESVGTGYKVSSFDRPGVICVLPAIINGVTFTVGQVVFFFLTEDGRGKILCADE